MGRLARFRPFIKFVVVRQIGDERHVSDQKQCDLRVDVCPEESVQLCLLHGS